MYVDALATQPSCQPKTITPGFVGNGDAVNFNFTQYVIYRDQLYRLSSDSDQPPSGSSWRGTN